MLSGVRVSPSAAADTRYKPTPASLCALTINCAHLRASCTNAARPSKRPSASTRTPVAALSHSPSILVSASAVALPPAISERAAVAAGESHAFKTKVALNVAMSGDGNAVLPTSSASAMAATAGIPMPPAASGTHTAVQPKSTICCQRAWSQTHSLGRSRLKSLATIRCSVSLLQ